MSQKAFIEDRVLRVKERMREIRPQETLQLMAVTKTRSRDESLWACAAGADMIGENRIQEAQQKWGERRPPVPLHAIGHVQSNKVKYGIGLFASIDTLDSERLAEILNQRTQMIQPVMIEVNIAGEAAKSGLAPDQVRSFIEGLASKMHLQVRGLMTVLPIIRENSVEERRRIRQHMQEMVDLWRICRGERFPWAPLDDLSMGMSGDWEWALEMGATVIRLGTEIFGPRLVQ